MLEYEPVKVETTSNFPPLVFPRTIRAAPVSDGVSARTVQVRLKAVITHHHKTKTKPELVSHIEVGVEGGLDGAAGVVHAKQDESEERGDR